MPRLTLVNVRDRFRVLFPLLFCLLFAPNAAHAAFVNVGFVLNLSAKEMVLENPNDPMVMKYSAWDTPTQRIADLNMPFLELTNDATSDAPITEFEMTIGDTRFHFSDVYFGDYIKLGDSTPGFNLDASATASDEDVLKVQILNGGLMPGETVRFRVDIDVDPGFPNIFPHQDFRLVFFQSPSMGGDPNIPTSVVTSIFSEGGMTESVAGSLDNYTTPNNQYFNNNIRPYSAMQGIDIFPFVASRQNEIPEPSSVVLLGLGAIAALVWRVRRRNEAQ